MTQGVSGKYGQPKQLVVVVLFTGHSRNARLRQGRFVNLRSMVGLSSRHEGCWSCKRKTNLFREGGVESGNSLGHTTLAPCLRSWSHACGASVEGQRPQCTTQSPRPNPTSGNLSFHTLVYPYSSALTFPWQRTRSWCIIFAPQAETSGHAYCFNPHLKSPRRIQPGCLVSRPLDQPHKSPSCIAVKLPMCPLSCSFLPSLA